MATVNRSKDKRFYYVRYDAGRDAQGKRIQKYKQFARKKDADTFLAEQVHSLKQGSYIESSKLLVGQYCDRWFEENRERLSPTTSSGYEINIRCHIKPFIGGIRLQALRPPDIRGMYRTLQKDREVKIEKEKRFFKALSGTSVQYVHRVLHKALEDAVNDELIVSNPASKVTPPAKEPFEAGCLDAKGIHTLLTKIRNDELYIPVLLAAVLGLRRSEVLGLQWTDVDFIHRIIRVRHAYIMGEGGPILRNKTKSDKSRRDIPVTDLLLSELKKHRNKQYLMKKRLKTYFVSRFVCTWPDGVPMNPSHLSRSFAERMQKYGLPVIRFHDLRHSNATLMISEGSPPKATSDRLGHATVQFTQDRYVHPDIEIQRQIAEQIDRAIFDSQK